ncbi:MAG: radical SAM protein [Ignisphaera sp.]
MKIILTAPATEMSEYNGNPAIAFIAGFSKPFFIPRSYLKNALYKPVPSNEYGEVVYAPLGIRLIEASLINSGMYRKEDIAIVHPDSLEERISESTRIVGISTKDPLGLGYVSLTYSTLIGLGDPINKYEFLQLMKRIMKLKKKYKFKVVVGGPGVWQFKLYDSISDKLGIDVIVSGEGEEIVPKIFSKLISGEHVEKFIEGGITPSKSIPCILGASIYGAIEVTRGCGRGCQFCTPTIRIKRDISLEKILRDVEVNLKNGQNKLLLVTEDLFLYGASYPWEPNGDALIKLIDSITKYKYHELKHVQVTHMNLAAVKYKKNLFKIIADKLNEFAWFKLRNNYICTVEVGIESGSPKIIGKFMRGKALPYTPEEWPEVVLESLILMEEHNWIPLATLIIGLPEENEDDAIKTLELISEIKQHGLRTFLVPLLFVPLGGCALEDQPLRSFEELSVVQLSIFSECWKHNVKIWGEEHFKNYNVIQKLLFKIMSRIYLVTTAKKYRWREQITLDIYSELKKLNDGDTKEYE